MNTKLTFQRLGFSFVFEALGAFWILVALKPEKFSQFSLKGPMWVDLALAGMFIAGGMVPMAVNKPMSYTFNLLSAACMAVVVYWMITNG